MSQIWWRNLGNLSACTKTKVAPLISAGKGIPGNGGMLWINADLSIMQSCKWMNESREDERRPSSKILATNFHCQYLHFHSAGKSLTLQQHSSQSRWRRDEDRYLLTKTLPSTRNGYNNYTRDIKHTEHMWPQEEWKQNPELTITNKVFKNAKTSQILPHDGS